GRHGSSLGLSPARLYRLPRLPRNYRLLAGTQEPGPRPGTLGGGADWYPVLARRSGRGLRALVFALLPLARVSAEPVGPDATHPIRSIGLAHPAWPGARPHGPAAAARSRARGPGSLKPSSSFAHRPLQSPRDFPGMEACGMARPLSVFLGLLLVVFLVGGPAGYAVHTQRTYRNFREVRDGVLFRSGQLSLGGLKRVI